jgi:hypothetical protein
MTGGPQSFGGGSRLDSCRFTTGDRIPARQPIQNGITTPGGPLGGSLFGLSAWCSGPRVARLHE